MAEILNCDARSETGTLRMRRLRKAGKTPAVLYGRGENVNLMIDSRDINNAIRHGSPIVELKGVVTESAMIKDIQWDPFGRDVLHLDLTRIDATEAVDVTLNVELVGDAPGTHSGGMLKHMLHEIQLKCPANAVPEKLELRINDLGLGDSLTADAIPLPQGASLLTAADEVVVTCVEVSEVDEEPAEAGEMSEPEVIGRKADDEDGEGGE